MSFRKHDDYLKFLNLKTFYIIFLVTNDQNDSEEEDELEHNPDSATDCEEGATTPIMMQTAGKLAMSPEHDDENAALERLSNLDSSPAEALSRLSQVKYS